MESLTNNPVSNKKYLIQLEGHDDVSLRDADWYNEKRDKLFEKYPNAQVFEFSDYDENDVRNTDQYAISINGASGTSIRDDAWYQAKKDKLHSTYGSNVKVQRVRPVDYWADKAERYETVIKAIEDAIKSYSEQLEGAEEGTKEYDHIVSNLEFQREQLEKFKAEHEANPRVIEARAAEAEYRKKLPSNLRDRIAESRKPVYIESGNKIFEEEKGSEYGLREKRTHGGSSNVKEIKTLEDIRDFGKTERKNILESDIESPRDMTSAMSPVESSRMKAEDIRSGKTNIPVDTISLNAAESFLDAYDYLENNKSSIAQGAWYSIWESVSHKDYDAVHTVLSKLEEKFKNLNNITAEQIDSVLSKEEKILLESYFLLAEEEAKTSNAFKGGQSAGESGKIMGEMLLWAAITYATGGAAAPAAGASITASLGKGAVKIGWNVVKGLGKWALKNAVKSVAFASLSPSSHKRMAQKQLQIGDNGRLMDEASDNIKYLAENATDYFSEFTGEGLASGFKYVKGLSKGSKFSNALSSFADTPVGRASSYLWNSKGAKIMGNLGIQGIVPEAFEEFETAVLNEVLGLDDNAIEDFFDKDNLGVTLISLSTISMLGAGVSTAAMINAPRKLSSAEARLRSALTPIVGEQRINDVVSQISSATTVNEIAEALDGLAKEMGAGNLSKENIKLLTKYGEAAANYKTLFSGEFEGADESVKLYTDAYADGQTMTEENLYDVNEAEQNARQAAIDSGAFDNGLSEDILNQSSADIASFLEEHKDELSDEATTALQNLAMAKSVKEGLDDSLRAAADDAVESYNDIATKCAKDNVLTIGMLDGKKVYIKTEREIENGMIVAPEGINVHMVEAIDSMTGESILVDSKLLSSVAKFDLEEYNTRMGNIIRDSFTQNWNNAQNTKSVASKLSDVTGMVGNKVLINTENGGMTEVEILQVLPDGNVIIKGKKGDLGGSSIQTVPVDAFYDSLSRDNNGNLLLNQTPNVDKSSSAAKNSVVDYRDGVYTLSVDGTTFDVEVTGQNDSSNTITYEYTDENGRTRIGRMSIDEFGAAIDNAANEEVAQVEETPAQPIAHPVETQVVEAQVEEPQAAPVQQEIDWDNLFDTDKNAYLSALQSEFGEEATDVLNEEIADAQKKIDKLAKKDYSTQNERMASRKERAKLQERINALTGMIGSISPAIVEEPQTQPQPEAKVETSNMRIGGAELKEPKKPVVRRPRNAEPTTGVELAAKELGAKNGGLKLDLDSFLKHTGYSLSEANKFKGLFLPADKGGLTVEGAGDRLMEIDSEYNLNLLDQNDPMAGVNAILDAIQSNKNMVELRSYTARNRQADMQREADAVYSYLYEQYETLLDEVHRDEIFGEELSARHALTEEEYNELNAIFAEEINDYGTEDIAGESDTLYETEDIGDLPVAEGEIYGGAEGSNQVLQETQPVQTRGEGNAQERGVGNEVTGENADSSVLNGDGSEVDFESSLEEDMPDFTTPDETLDNGYIVKDGKIINPTVIEMPNSSKEANRIFIAEKDGKWGYGWYATMDNGTSSWTDTIQLENLRYDSKEDAIKAALKYFDFYKNYRSNSKHGSTQLDTFVKYVNKAYLNGEAVAPNPVANPIAEAQKLEKHLAAQLEKTLTDAHKQDLATSIGKKIGNLFATREEYDAYQETATDFGKYNDNVEAGVDESFASRNQYQIGNEEYTESEATDLVNEAIDLSLEGSKVDVVRPADEHTKDMLKLAGVDPNTQWSIDADKPIFVSNAAVAVANIKMEKATPEQWLKMLEKGGLKAAEDKWMGLSDWLKASDKKTLTKQEVLDYINENTIRIEEVHYSESAEDNAREVMTKIEDTLNDKYHSYISEYYDEHEDDDMWGTNSQEYAIEKLREEMGDTEYPYTIEVSGNDAWVVFTYEEVDELQKWADKLGIEFTPENPANETRLNYTTDGLENKKEIALVLPSIDPWHAHDEIHFGDAGDGRAVAWVRFGEVESPVQDANYKRLQEIYDRLAQLGWKIYNEGLSVEEYEERSRLIEERDNLQELEGKTQRVLVIDEIQSKRHQEGREKGYKVSREKADAEMNKFMKRMHDKYDFSSSTPFSEVFNDEEMREYARLSMQQHRATFGTTTVPDAPFDKNWHELAMKRMLRYAAENGYDAIAWTKGKQQAERYALSKSFNGIEREDRPDGEGGRRFTLYGGNIDTIYVDESGVITSSSISDEFKGKHLSDVVGKDIANKMMSLENNDIIEGEDLTIGGEGMKGFYDKMLPTFMDKYGKKWGVKTADIELPNVEKAGRFMHSVQVTEAMKQSVMEGQTMFFKTQNGTVYGWTDGKKIYLTKAGMNPNTKIHEYTHLWAKAMMQKNRAGWESVKSLLKNTPVWKEVMNDANYSDIHNNEDMVASEVLSRISGRENAAKLDKMAKQMIDEAKGTMRKVEARGLIQNIKDALNKFWNWVGTELFGIEKFDSVEQVTDRVLWDLINQTDLGNLSAGSIEAQIVTPSEVSRQTASQVYDKTVDKNWQEFQRQFQDAYQPVRIAIDAIQQETGNIPIEDYENYLLAQNQSSSRSRVEIDNFTRKFYSPIIKQVNDIIDVLLKSRGANVKDKAARAEAYKDVRKYLIAKHGLERNAYYQNEKGEMRDYSGLTSLFGLNSSEFEEAERQAQEFVDNFEISLGKVYDANDDVLYQSEEVEALWRKINAATDKTLRHSYECGLLSRKQYEDIKAMFKYYIPLRGFDETTAEDVYSYARFEGNRFNPAVKKAEGRTSIADDPLAMIMNMAESEIAQGNKNRAKQSLYNYLLNRAAANDEQNTLMQIEDVWYIKTVDAYGNEVYTIATPDRSAGETYDEFEDRMKLLAEQDLAKKSDKSKVDVGMRFQKKMDEGSHYVHLKVNGVEKAIFINGNPKAADAINGTNVPKMGDGMKKVKNVQRLLSSTFTNYSLEFTARNYFRDLIYSHINISMRESNPEYRRKFRKNWRRNNMLTMLSMLDAYKAGKYDTMNLSADEAMFVEFMENGGQTGYTLINSVEAHKKDLEKAIERMRSGVENGGIKDSTIFKYTLGAIELLNEASELVTRYAAYKTSREMGRGVETSISNAKEVTVNFNTKGAQDGTGWMGVIARYLGAVKYFFNASVQGVQNLKAMAEANKGKFCTTVGGIMGLGILMPVIQGALLEMLGGDDDDNWYWNIPEYERQNNLCFVIGNGKYAKIPLPIGFREMYGIGDIIAGGLFDKKFTRDILSVSVDVANKISTIVLPINPLEGSANGLSLIESAQDMIMPDATQGMIQNRTNKDWKGAPIQKEYTYNENDPQWTKAFASNPSWLTGLSKWCYENIVIDGKSLDFSPEKLDNTLNNLFGGIYSLTKKTGRTVSMIWNEEERNLSNVPLVGVIIGSGIDKDDRFVNSTYWEMDEYFNDRIYLIENTAKRFGLSLDDVFERVPYGEARAGEHHPKMSEIYNRDNFEFMQEWYLGHKGENTENEYGEKILGLDQIRNKIKGINDKINKTEDEDIKLELAEEVVELNNLYETTRRDLVNYLLELD